MEGNVHYAEGLPLILLLSHLNPVFTTPPYPLEPKSIPLPFRKGWGGLGDHLAVCEPVYNITNLIVASNNSLSFIFRVSYW
jgi:hypothetical protein